MTISPSAGPSVGWFGWQGMLSNHLRLPASSSHRPREATPPAWSWTFSWTAGGWADSICRSGWWPTERLSPRFSSRLMATTGRASAPDTPEWSDFCPNRSGTSRRSLSYGGKPARAELLHGQLTPRRRVRQLGASRSAVRHLRSVPPLVTVRQAFTVTLRVSGNEIPGPWDRFLPEPTHWFDELMAEDGVHLESRGPQAI